MLKVAYISANPDVPVFGWQGSSVHIQEIIRAFKDLGAEVSLFPPPPDGYAPPDLIDLNVREIRIPEARNEAEKEEALLAANRQLIHALEQHGPFDIVYERYEEDYRLTRGPEGIYTRPSEKPGFGLEIEVV